MPPKKTAPAPEPQAEVKLCTAPCCNRPQIARGLCATHYRRQTRAEAAGEKVDLRAPVRRVDGTLCDLKARIPEEAMAQIERLASNRGSTSYRIASDVVSYTAEILEALKAARKDLPPASLARAQVESVLGAAFGEE